MAAKMLFLRVEPGDLATLVPRQQLIDDCAAEAAQLVGQFLRIVPGDASLR